MLLQFEANIHLRFISGANLIQSLSWKGIVDMRAAKIAVESIHDMYLMMMVVESGNAMQADFLECQHGTLHVSRANLILQYLLSFGEIRCILSLADYDSVYMRSRIYIM